MYTPTHFEESRVSVLHSLMRAYPFAALVTMASNEIGADHVPLLLLECGDGYGALRGHVARANPVWRNVSDGSDVFVIFQGPNRYVSPKWYPSKQEHGRVVPTWNYLVVHARGKIRWHHDPGWLRGLLDATTEAHEGSDRPWRVSDAPDDFVAAMLSGIVGFEVEISELTGKWKLSQNRSSTDRAGIVAGLKAQSDSAATEMLSWMGDAGSES